MNRFQTHVDLHGVRRTGLGVALALWLVCPTPDASESQRLQEVTKKWREGRASQRPVEVFLRPLVAADPNFQPDPSLGAEHLDETMRPVYWAIRVLLAEGLRTQFLGLSTDSLRAEWLRRYWMLKDPTPTTTRNERRQEHERRVEKARHEFSWKEPPYWDDRGEVFIAFGRPDTVIEHRASVEEGIGFVPARQEWLFLDEKWVADFWRPNPKGPWRLGGSTTRLSYRPDLVARDKRLLGIGTELEAPSDYERAGDLLGQLDERTLLAQGDFEGMRPEAIQHEIRTDLRARMLLRKRREAVVNFRKEVESGGERFRMAGKPKGSIWYIFDVDVFKGRPGRMRVEVHYQFNLQDLQFAWVDSLYLASYRAEGVLLDSWAREAARDEYTEKVRSDDFRSTFAAQLVPGQLVFYVPEGQYRLAIRFTDLRSGDESTYLTDVMVPRLDQRALAMSDIQMASRIVYAGDDWSSRFIKNDRLVVPHPMSAYQREQTLTGYFEIYGLELAENNSSRYQVTYSIVPRSGMQAQGWFPAPGTTPRPFVTSSFTGEGGTRDLVEELRIDVSSLRSDVYDLVLTVRDLVAGAETSARKSFSVLE